MIDEIGIEGIGLGFLHLPLLQLVFFLSLSHHGMPLSLQPSSCLSSALNTRVSYRSESDVQLRFILGSFTGSKFEFSQKRTIDLKIQS